MIEEAGALTLIETWLCRHRSTSSHGPVQRPQLGGGSARERPGDQVGERALVNSDAERVGAASEWLVAGLDRFRDDQVGVDCVIQAAQRDRFRSAPQQLGSQPHQVARLQGCQRPTGTLPTLDGGDVHVEMLGQSSLSQPDRLPNQLEQEAGDDAQAARRTPTTTRCSSAADHRMILPYVPELRILVPTVSPSQPRFSRAFPPVTK